MKNIEMNHFYNFDDEVIAVYHNPDSFAGGTFMIHHFPKNYIKRIFDMYGCIDDDILDCHLFGNAFDYPTYCVDIGSSDYYNFMDMEDGDIPDDPCEYINRVAEGLI